MTIGVLVMAYGTPTTRDDVEAYYTRIRHGRPPTPELLADLVRRYEAIGGTSPLAERTARQVAALAAALEEHNRGEYVVVFGSKYEPPLLEEAARELLARGVERVIGLVLAPHSSSMSTDQYMDRARAALGQDVDFTPIGAWWDAEGFCELIGERVRAALATVPAERRATTEVVFSAHSLPEKILENGDTYPEQLAESARRAASAAGLARHELAWQSAGRTGDVWLGPDILVVLAELAARGVTDVVSCPIGFVADHLEVLYDIDVDGQRVAHEVGINLVRTASLNDDPDFIDVLAKVVESA
ncbi:MAG TPA: ferrochelatase [Acidimicrobiales bacterium]|nr:ferrochelatase [Acidimicrobiales bacterium]